MTRASTHPRGPERRASVVGVLGAALAVSALGGIATGLLLASSAAFLNDWGFGSDALLLAGYLTLLYTAVYVVVFGAAALAALAVGRRPGSRTFAGLLAGFAVFLTAILRFNPAIQLGSVVPSLNAIGVIDLLMASVLSLAVAVAIAGTSRSVRIAAAASALLVFAGLQGLNLWHEHPVRRHLDREVPAAIAGGGTELVREPDRFEAARLVVLGFDGLTWEMLLPLIERGELPNFRWLLRDAAYGYLDTLPFTISPVIWETINSGQPPRRHGIGYHVHFAFPGLQRHLAQLPAMRLCNSPMGLRRLLVATDRYAPWSVVPVSSVDARAARLWEIASRHGLTVGVFKWMNAAPVAPLATFVNGYGAIEPLNHPPDLQQSFPPLPPRLDINPQTRESDVASEPEYERALWSRFVELSLARRPELMMYYTHYADAVNHLNWKLETVGEPLLYSGWRHPALDPGPWATTAHRLLDSMLGDVLRRLPDDAVLAVVSDHGFDFRGYEHDNAPPGVVILRGPGIRPGVISNASIFDVAPTLLHVLGIPAARDMPGTVLPAVLGERPERVASYGEAISTQTGASDPDSIKEQLDYLRSLGYVVE